jgi:hypothetical protein
MNKYQGYENLVCMLIQLTLILQSYVFEQLITSANNTALSSLIQLGKLQQQIKCSINPENRA